MLHDQMKNLPMFVDGTLVCEVVFKMNKESAAGLSGFGPLQLKGTMKRESWRKMVSEKLATFLNRVIKEKKIPLFMNKSRLCPIPKSNGGVRPISAGETLYRLLMSLVKQHIMVKYMERQTKTEVIQYECGVKNGQQQHSLLTKVLVEEALNGEVKEVVVVGIDIQNAFGNVSRDTIGPVLRDLGEKEELITLVLSTYDKELLMYKGTPVPNACGVKQGDPVAMLIFSLVWGAVMRKAVAILEAEHVPKVRLGNSSIPYFAAFADDPECIGPDLVSAFRMFSVIRQA
jgi:hypothetical protein